MFFISYSPIQERMPRFDLQSTVHLYFQSQHFDTFILSNNVIHLVTLREIINGFHRVNTFKSTHLDSSEESASSHTVLYNTEHRRAAAVLSSLLCSCLDRRGLFSSASRNWSFCTNEANTLSAFDVFSRPYEWPISSSATSSLCWTCWSQASDWAPWGLHCGVRCCCWLAGTHSRRSPSQLC